MSALFSTSIQCTSKQGLRGKGGGCDTRHSACPWRTVARWRACLLSEVALSCYQERR
ncbi:hypothetical protein Cadr_000027973 [Camelus dromedarius]|uniref:Uncharacterized protein n=1 Tax=Camelus dromedarius TaxID=9838 RepID=A0A5N4C9F1_CAMDR|nr:hypothetical protein Cadr_000027973 [Camelus dromedarius]